MPSNKKESAGIGQVDFSKAHILTFKRYADRRDLLSVLLKEDQRYTMDQVDSLIENFQTTKGKVK